jgi:hypothetical protein
MSIASLTVPAAFTPFQNFFRWLGTPHQRAPARLATAALPTCRPVTPPAFLRQRAAIKRVNEPLNSKLSMHPVPPTAPQTVRVVRMLETGQHRNCVGRMVISGRMVDVCAELDRLASREEICRDVAGGVRANSDPAIH